jgi:hypothetical protein
VRTLLLLSLEFENILNGFFHSRPSKILARCGWSLYVGLRGTSLYSRRRSNSKAAVPAGSSSLLLTSSGASFKGIAATGGRSGSVIIAPS